MNRYKESERIVQLVELYVTFKIHEALSAHVKDNLGFAEAKKNADTAAETLEDVLNLLLDCTIKGFEPRHD